MEVHLTSEQEIRLSQIAVYAGKDVDQLVFDAALQLLEEDAAIRNAAREGIAQADRGEFLEESEMDAKMKALLSA